MVKTWGMATAVMAPANIPTSDLRKSILVRTKTRSTEIAEAIGTKNIMELRESIPVSKEMEPEKWNIPGK